MSDYKKLENQPLMFVLAEFRFSPVMQIAEYIPKFQERLRKHYPVSQKSAEQAVHVQPNGMSVSTIDRWSFVSTNKKSAIDINQERLLYVTADYPRFDGFSDACEQAVNFLAEIVDPTLLLRVGLRYSDLIKPEGSEKMCSLIDDHFVHPQCLSLIGDAQQHRTETFLHTKMGGLVIRTLHGKHNLTYLPDMQGLPIAIPRNNQSDERLILDIDHFWEAREDTVNFQPHDVIEKLGMLHETSRETFWKITTDYARNQKWT